MAKIKRRRKRAVKEEPKVVLEIDMYPHLVQRIDHYLCKRWPDLFVDENFKKFKEDYEGKYNDLQGKEERINAQMEEFKYRFTELIVNSELKMIKRFNLRFESLEKRTNWWKCIKSFFKDKVKKHLEF
jgi:hypothetical protein